jgi:hypothetical protein
MTVRGTRLKQDRQDADDAQCTGHESIPKLLRQQGGAEERDDGVAGLLMAILGQKLAGAPAPGAVTPGPAVEPPARR